MVDFGGFDEFDKRMDSARGNVSIREIFTAQFMSENTQFTTFDDFARSNPFPEKTPAELFSPTSTVLDEYVKANSKFQTWVEMLRVAGQQYIKGKLKV